MRSYQLDLSWHLNVEKKNADKEWKYFQASKIRTKNGKCLNNIVLIALGKLTVALPGASNTKKIK